MESNATTINNIPALIPANLVLSPEQLRWISDHIADTGVSFSEALDRLDAIQTLGARELADEAEAERQALYYEEEQRLRDLDTLDYYADRIAEEWE